MGKRRNEFLLWGYVLFMGFVAIPVVGFLLSRIAPVSPSQIPEILLYGLLVLFFWFVDLKIYFGGEYITFETSAWFLFTVLALRGPVPAFAAYFLGAGLYCLTWRNVAPIVRVGTMVLNTLPYGLAFLILYRLPLGLNLNQPLLLIASFTLIFILQAFALIVICAAYYVWRDGAAYWGAFKSMVASSRAAWLVLILVLPGLSYITAVFWQAHFYVSAVLLLVPFLLLRRVTQNVLKAVEDIMNTIEAIVLVIEAKDPYTHYHCNRVALYAMAIAIFCGFGEGFVQRIGRIARLHDVGKVMVRDRVLKKDGRLSEEEYEHIKIHSDPNKVLMNKIPDNHPMKEFIELGRHHHERFDGKGYPDQLEGERIPIEIRIISMADAWDAMTSDRVYRKGLDHEKALSEVEKFKGKQWDPVVVSAFKEAYEAGAIAEAIRNPSILTNPVLPWTIHPKSLRYVAPPSMKRSSSLRDLMVGKWHSILFSIFLSSLFFFAYFFHGFPLHGSRIILYFAFAVLMEFWEIKLLKSPRFYPVESVLLALLFVIPLEGVLGLILFLGLIRLFYEQKVNYSIMITLLKRILLFSLSILFFEWIGFAGPGSLLVPRSFFEVPLRALFLLAVFLGWGILYSSFSAVFLHLILMIRRRLWRVSWDLQAFKRSLFFNLLLVAPFAFLLLSFHTVNPIHFPFLLLSFVLICAMSQRLLENYRNVIEGNAKTLEALALATEERFAFYKGHTEHVTALSLEIGEALGLSDEELESLSLASRIFGLGNIGVPDEILDKQGPLTENEIRTMKQHVEISGQIAAQYSFYKEEVSIIWSHCEAWDGSGYPSHLQGESIPLGARILAVSDSFYAMLSDRPHRKALSIREAFQEIKSKTGTLFDPQVVAALMKVI